MFAINHAAAALVIKKIFPDVPMLWILISVQFMELIWVVLNSVGIERISTEKEVADVSDIHLEYMPYSHSVATMTGMAFLSWFMIAIVFHKPDIALAVGAGIISHLLLDLLSHGRDIALTPFAKSPKIGLGLYSRLPIPAFFVEVGFGLVCWWIYGGGYPLLAAILGFNFANLSSFFAAVPGIERKLAGRPMLITTVVFIQIVVTLAAVGLLS